MAARPWALSEDAKAFGPVETAGNDRKAGSPERERWETAAGEGKASKGARVEGNGDIPGTRKGNQERA